MLLFEKELSASGEGALERGKSDPVWRFLMLVVVIFVGIFV
jgi:hypothetical protein